VVFSLRRARRHPGWRQTRARGRARPSRARSWRQRRWRPCRPFTRGPSSAPCALRLVARLNAMSMLLCLLLILSRSSGVHREASTWAATAVCSRALAWCSPAVLDGRAAAAVPRPPPRSPTQPQAPRLATDARAAAHSALAAVRRQPRNYPASRPAPPPAPTLQAAPAVASKGAALPAGQFLTWCCAHPADNLVNSPDH